MKYSSHKKKTHMIIISTQNCKNESDHQSFHCRSAESDNNNKKKERGGESGANKRQTTLPSMPGGGIRFGPLLALAVNG